jgi:hypothetical protein
MRRLLATAAGGLLLVQVRATGRYWR